MKRFVALVVVALLGFYVAWPAWSGYRLKTAFDTNDAALLESKVDFPSVRASLKPFATGEIQRQIERLAREAGPLGAALAGQIKGDVLTRLAESSVNTVITPPNLLRIAREGRDIKQAVERVLAEQMGRQGGGGADNAGGGGRLQVPGGLGGLGTLAERLGRRPAGDASAPAPQPAPAADAKGDPAAKPPMGLANIKRFRLDGPLAFSLGFARDATASEPDVTAQFGFTGGDWKLVGIEPKASTR